LRKLQAEVSEAELRAISEGLSPAGGAQAAAVHTMSAVGYAGREVQAVWAVPGRPLLFSRMYVTDYMLTQAPRPEWRYSLPRMD
jgi:hypothetical protein